MPICRDVGQIDIALRCVLISAKHRIDGLTKLGAARLVDAAGVHLEVV
jgi:hypothetical protein